MAHNLVERESQVSLLDISLAQARGGDGQLVLLDGAAGVGKTSLVAAAVALATESGMTALVATADEFEAGFGWGVVLQLFERHIARLSTEQRDAVFGGPAAHAEPLLSEARTGGLGDTDELAGADEVVMRASAIHHALYWVTSNLAERSPVLVAVDDLQWADSPSVAFLAYLARRLEDLPVCLLLAARTGVENATSRVRARLARDERAHRVVPPALSRAGVAGVVRSSRTTASDEVCASVYSASGGNPFLVSVATSIIGEATSESDEALAARLSNEAPQDLLRAMEDRLGALDDVTLAMARALATVGVRPSFDVATAVSGLGESAARAALDALARHELIAITSPSSDLGGRERDGLQEVSFHPLIRTAIVEMTPHDWLEELHGRAVTVLGALQRAPEEIALHASASRAAGSGATVEVLVEAAYRARRAGAPDIAMTLLRRALREPPTDEQRPRVLALVARCGALLGSSDLEALFTAAIDAEPDDHARCVLQFHAGRALVSQRRYAAATDVFEAAIASDDERDPVFTSQLIAAQLAAIRFDPGRRHEWKPRITALAERMTKDATTIDPALAGEVAYSFGATGSDFEQAHRFALRAVEGDDGVTMAFTDTMAWSTTMHALHQVNEYEIGRSVAEKVVARAQELGSSQRFGLGSTYLSVMNLRLGNLTDALASMSTVDRSYRTSMRILAALSAVTLAQTYLALGRIDDAAATMSELEERLDDSDLFAQGLPETWGWIHLANGEPDRAVKVLSTMERPRSTIGNMHPATTNWRSAYARALHATGEHAQALAVSDRELELARPWGAPRALGYALTTAGLVRPARDGLPFLDEAVTVLAPSQSPLRHGWALAERAGRRRELGRTDAARDDAREAAGIAEAHRAQLLADRAEAELRAAGGRPRRRAVAGVDSLTPAELRVARAAAAGQTNAEIAADLFVSRKAVEFHLSNVYRKLVIQGRRGIAAALDA